MEEQKRITFKSKLLNANREWCANAQIHGLSFLVKTKRKFNFIMWSIVIFFSIGIGLIGIVGIILEFLEYKVVESVNKVRLNQMIPFPSVTICK